MAHDDDEKKSSATAKAGLALGITGTALSLLRGGEGGLGGLDGLLGGRRVGRSVSAETEAIAYDTERRIANMEAKIACLETATVKDQEIDKLRTELAEQKSLRYIDQKTCHMVEGKTYLSPNHMADPYMAGRNVLVSEHVNALGIGINGYRGRDFDTWY